MSINGIIIENLSSNTTFDSIIDFDIPLRRRNVKPSSGFHFVKVDPAFTYDDEEETKSKNYESKPDESDTTKHEDIEFTETFTCDRFNSLNSGLSYQANVEPSDVIVDHGSNSSDDECNGLSDYGSSYYPSDGEPEPGTTTNDDDSSLDDETSDPSFGQQPRTVGNVKLKQNKTLATALSCNDCFYTSTTKQGMLEHCRRVHLNLPDGRPSRNAVVQCQLCFYSTTKLHRLKEHMLVHDVNKRHTCSLCSFASHYKRCLLKHISCRHPDSELNIEVNTNTKFYTCPKCPYKSVFRSSATKHFMSVHSRVRPFKCPQCDYAAKRKSHLVSHVNNVHKPGSGAIKRSRRKCTDYIKIEES